jgi:hypothetical protein
VEPVLQQVPNLLSASFKKLQWQFYARELVWIPEPVTWSLLRVIRWGSQSWEDGDLEQR